MCELVESASDDACAPSVAPGDGCLSVVDAAQLLALVAMVVVVVGVYVVTRQGRGVLVPDQLTGVEVDVLALVHLPWHHPRLAVLAVAVPSDARVWMPRARWRVEPRRSG